MSRRVGQSKNDLWEIKRNQIIDTHAKEFEIHTLGVFSQTVDLRISTTELPI